MAKPVPGSAMVVETCSVIRNAKNARGPFPSRARLIFALLLLIRSHYTIWEPGTGYSWPWRMIQNYIIINCGVVLFDHSSMKITQVTLLLTMFMLYIVPGRPGYTLSLCTHRGPSVKGSRGQISGRHRWRYAFPSNESSAILYSLCFCACRKTDCTPLFFTVNRSPAIRGYKKSFGANIWSLKPGKYLKSLREANCLHDEERQLSQMTDMWSEQSTEQDSNPTLILENTILGSGEEQVIVKLLTTNTSVSSNGSEVFTKLLTGSSAGAAAGSTGKFLSGAQAQGLRKIEPKPADSGNESEKLVEGDGEGSPFGR